MSHRTFLAIVSLASTTSIFGCSSTEAPQDSTQQNAAVSESEGVFGINIDPNNDEAWAQTAPKRLVSEGFRGVRFVSRASVQPRIDELKKAGLKVMAIVTSESDGYVPPNADFVQIGNEPDDANTAVSPSDYADTWVLYRNTYPKLAGHFVMAALDSGGLNAVNYAKAAIAAIGDRAPLPDLVDIHPYGKSPSEAAGDFDLMWNAFSIPVITTEWHNEDDTWNFQCMLGDPTSGRSTVWNSAFCYTDAMVPDFGMRDGDGKPKAFYYQLLSAPKHCR